MTDDVPDLTSQQRAVIRTFTRRHRDETEGRISVNPIRLVRVVVGDRPTAEIDLKGEETHPNLNDPDAYLHDLCDTFGLHAKKIKGLRSWTVGWSRWRLDLLPTTVSETEGYHRRCGFVYGYPIEAIEDFIETTSRITPCDLVRAGFFSAKEIAYLTFVPYTFHNSLEKFELLIEEGKAIRDRIRKLADVWQLPILAEYATLLHEDTIQAYLGKGTYRVSTSFPPDQEVTKNDVEPLLS